MSQGQLPGGARITKAAGSHQLPGGSYVLGSIPVVKVRALIMINGQISQVVNALVGTNKKPLVWYNSQCQERSGSEGIPIVLDQGQLRQLRPGETLMI